MTYQGTRSVWGCWGASPAAFFFGDTRFFFGMKKEMGVNHPAAWRRNPRAVGAVSPCPPQWAKKRRRERHKVRDDVWQGQKDLNPRHAVLETAALPTELYPYLLC